MTSYVLVARADILRRRCSRLLGWDAAQSDAALTEYERFMRLKADLLDFDGRQLLPSLDVESVWRLHVLDTRAYARDCHAFCGAMIHHHADDDCDVITRRGRAVTTLYMYRTTFEAEPPAATWAYGDAAIDLVSTAPMMARPMAGCSGPAPLPGAKRVRAAQVSSRGRSLESDLSSVVRPWMAGRRLWLAALLVLLIAVLEERIRPPSLILLHEGEPSRARP